MKLATQLPSLLMMAILVSQIVDVVVSNILLSLTFFLEQRVIIVKLVRLVVEVIRVTLVEAVMLAALATPR
jgi:hypothetical protein